MTDETISFRALGFLAAFPGREYRISDEPSGLLKLQTVAFRLLGDDLVEAANAEELRLGASFDDAHPDFVLLETIDEPAPVMRFAAALEAMRYHRLDQAEAAAPAAEEWQDPDYPPRVDLDSLPDPMTDEDVARFLRRRNRQSVQRLRLDGLLPFRPGRPPMVTKADLLAYIESAKVQVVVKDRKLLAAEARQTAREKANAEARAWAIEMLNRPKRAKRGKSG